MAPEYPPLSDPASRAELLEGLPVAEAVDGPVSFFARRRRVASDGPSSTAFLSSSALSLARSAAVRRLLPGFLSGPRRRLGGCMRIEGARDTASQPEMGL
jgi:hypothetical protein